MSDQPDERPHDSTLEPGSEPPSTASLLESVRRGDAGARDRLVRHFLPALQAWARGRLPLWARDLTDTDDLVQVTLLRALDRVKEFEPRRKGAFLAYLRRILSNQVRDQIRGARRRPDKEPIDERVPRHDPSPLEQAIGRETLEAYEAALARLPEQQQEAVIMRIELGFTHREVAEWLDCPSTNAARMMVARALVRLAESMDER